MSVIAVRALEPEPIEDSTQQFLRPLVGIDPASVPVYRGALAARLTQAHAADAITIGDHVMLADGQSTAGPSGAALLAHELTHVARHRQPRFVPPVVADVSRAGASTHATPTIAPQTDAAATGHWASPEAGPVDGDNDEAVARSVERAVRQSAHVHDLGASFEPGPHQVGAPEHHPLPHDDRQSGSSAWGGLPAPWEPLPAWLTTPAPASAVAAHAAPDHTVGIAANVGPGPSLAPGTNLGVADNGVGGGNDAALQVFAAEHGRDTDSDADSSATTSGVTPGLPANPHEGTVEPDLDALARQVYTVLRRRLASEQRRFG